MSANKILEEISLQEQQLSKLIKYNDINIKNISLFEEDLNTFENEEILSMIVLSKSNIDIELTLQDIVLKKETNIIMKKNNYNLSTVIEESLKTNDNEFLQKMKKLTTVTSLLIFISKIQNQKERYLEIYEVYKIKNANLEKQYDKLTNLTTLAEKLKKTTKTKSKLQDLFSDLGIR